MNVEHVNKDTSRSSALTCFPLNAHASQTVLLKQSKWKGNWAAIALKLTYLPCFFYHDGSSIPLWEHQTLLLHLWFLLFWIEPRGTIQTHFWKFDSQLIAIRFREDPSTFNGFLLPWHGCKGTYSIDGFGQGELRKQGTPQAFQTMTSQVKWTAAIWIHFISQGLTMPRLTSKDNPLAILCAIMVLQRQHCMWPNWRLPWRNWHRIHIFQFGFSSQRLKDLFSKSNGPKWANWLSTTSC